MKLSPAGGVAIDNVAGQNHIGLAITLDSTGTTVVESGTLRLGPDARGPVLSGGGVDIQRRQFGLRLHRRFLFLAAGTIQTLLAWSYDDGIWDRGQFRSTTAVSTGLSLGWKDDDASKVTVMATYAADFNLDGAVNQLDLNIWMANAGAQNPTFLMGDANYDGAINGLDLDLWNATNGQVLSPAHPPATGRWRQLRRLH